MGQRLEIEPVAGVRVGRDRLRVAVDHDRLEAGILEREGGVAAPVVDLEALPDAVRAAAEYDDLASLGNIGLILRLAEQRRLVGRIELGRRGIETDGPAVA